MEATVRCTFCHERLRSVELEVDSTSGRVIPDEETLNTIRGVHELGACVDKEFAAWLYKWQTATKDNLVYRTHLDVLRQIFYSQTAPRGRAGSDRLYQRSSLK